MKTRLLSLVIIFLPCLSFGQTSAEYEHIMAKIVRFYNSKETDSLRSLFANGSDLDRHGRWDMEDFHDVWGNIMSYKQTLLHEGYVFFESTFSGGCRLMSPAISLTMFSLDENAKVGDFSPIGGYR